MKPIVIENSFIPKLIFWMPVKAITLVPFIFFRGKMDETALTHEKIHVPQYLELWVIGFPIIYFWDFLCAYWLLRNVQEAYRRIRLEQEAYDHQNDFDYPNKRAKFAWGKYKV